VPLLDAHAPGRRGLIEKIVYRNFQDRSDELKSSGADPIGAVLVFLNLLERYAESFREFLLRQSFLQTKRTHALANRNVE
jgi:hypothetical protein